MSEIIRKLTGVGPRLVSPSVRAAEKLPSSVKIESLKRERGQAQQHNRSSRNE